MRSGVQPVASLCNKTYYYGPFAALGLRVALILSNSESQPRDFDKAQRSSRWNVSYGL
jgi:hypothetical protein